MPALSAAVLAFVLAPPLAGDSGFDLEELRTAVESKAVSLNDAFTDPRWRSRRDEPAFRDFFVDRAPATRAVLAPPGEPGSPLVVSGRILDEAGRPVMDALVYAYHTDAKGLYSDPTPDRRGGDNQRPRIGGLVRTDHEGRYEFRTIRPAGYPNSGAAEHVHYEVHAALFEPRVTELMFDDDPRLVPDARRGAERSGYVISKVTRDDAGVQHASCDVVLERVAEPRLDEIRKAIAGRSAVAAAVLVDPRYEDLHPDPRFREIVRDAAAAAPLAIAFPDEPGTPLLVAATVRDASGAPVAGALVYAYQTDARGWYAKDRPHAYDGDVKHARLFGYVRTGDDGRFSLRTIRPAGYPKSTLPQHVHVEVRMDGYSTLVTEFLFEDDPRLTAEVRAEALREGEKFLVSPVARGADGVERANYEIVLAGR